MRWKTHPCVVVPEMMTPGIYHVRDAVTPLAAQTMQEALRRRWETEALFTLYTIEEPGRVLVEPQTRLNKGSLDSLRAAGADAVSRFMAFDFDLVGPTKKPEWNDELLTAASDAWTAACAQHPLLERHCAWYTTPHGFRAIYLLALPTPVDQLEPLLHGMLGLFRGTELSSYLDASCCDWTRLFRFPRVRKASGIYTDALPYYSLVINEDATPIGAQEIPVALQKEARKYGEISRLPREAAPTPDAAKALLFEPDGTTPSAWLRAAYNALRGRPAVDYIDGKKKLEDTGQRNENLLKYLGSTVNLLFSLPGTSQCLVYGLWVDAVEQLEARTGDDDGKPWLGIAWEMLQRCWEKETAAAVVVAAEKKIVTEQTGRLSDLVLTGMRAWCKHPFLHNSDGEGLKFVQTHAIATFGGSQYHVLRSDGYYDATSVTLVNIPARVRELGMDKIITLQEECAIGRGEVEQRQIPLNNLLARHATLVNRREGAVGVPGSFVRDIESDGATFVFRMYERRRDLMPAYDRDVDAWLHAFGGDCYQDLMRWISHALNFEGGPICALSLDARAGVGKKLLVQGLAECINTMTVADAKEMTGRFQSQLLHTPFLLVNEGLPRIGRDAQIDPADAFRALVSGDPIHVEEKGRGIITIRNPVRVIITANNDQVLRSLYAHRDLSPADREALAIRLLHLSIDAQGADWLRAKGGIGFTGRPGRRWIQGDDGAPSDFVVARHFLYLHKNRPPVPAGNRLLVEGPLDAEIVREMAVNSGGSPEVIEVVISMLEQTCKPPGLEVFEGEVYVTTAGVRDHHSSLARSRGGMERMSLARIASVLKGLAAAGKEATQRSFNGGPRVRWWHLDLDTLGSLATQYGSQSTKLSSLLYAHHTSKMGAS